jgi:hypothetical protein
MMEPEAVMGTKWKPVQPTEIKDIKIIREVIAQIRKPIPKEVYDRIDERGKHLRAAWEQMDREELSRKWAAIRLDLAEKADSK